MRATLGALTAILLLAGPVQAQDMAHDMTQDGAEHHHDHPAPETLGRVHFATDCAPAVAGRFDRAVALLHSFAYGPARQAFAEVAVADPRCAMALWGEAMTHYHQLWEPPVESPAELAEGLAEIRHAIDLGTASPRERDYIAAVAQYYADAEHASPAVRARRYSDAMAGVAQRHPTDSEAQVFYALSLVATASPADRTHANQKRAAAILEPIWRRQPDHPGAPHYLIHAYDSAELAPRGLAAARAYAKIAPSEPHALHMPSHIFTRLGAWRDSVASNTAARAAAQAQGDLGEALHAMDYLTYADLQLGRVDDARQVAAAARALPGLTASQFKVGYAANAMAVRVAVETGDWPAAAALEPLPGSAPKTAAIVWWARALGHSRGAAPDAAAAQADIVALQGCRDTLRAAQDAYWADQAEVMLQSARAWSVYRAGNAPAAVAALTAAADQEDALEKLPVTPGPIVPAREQLGELLLALHRPKAALQAFQADLRLAPGRRGGLEARSRRRGHPATRRRRRFQRQLQAN